MSFLFYRNIQNYSWVFLLQALQLFVNVWKFDILQVGGGWGWGECANILPTKDGFTCIEHYWEETRYIED